jgi:hypothetical protein
MIRNVPHTETVKKKVFVKIGRPGECAILAWHVGCRAIARHKSSSSWALFDRASQAADFQVTKSSRSENRSLSGLVCCSPSPCQKSSRVSGQGGE